MPQAVTVCLYGVARARPVTTRVVVVMVLRMTCTVGVVIYLSARHLLRVAGS